MFAQKSGVTYCNGYKKKALQSNPRYSAMNCPSLALSPNFDAF